MARWQDSSAHLPPKRERSKGKTIHSYLGYTLIEPKLYVKIVIPHLISTHGIVCIVRIVSSPILEAFRSLFLSLFEGPFTHQGSHTRRAQTSDEQAIGW